MLIRLTPLINDHLHFLIYILKYISITFQNNLFIQFG